MDLEIDAPEVYLALENEFEDTNIHIDIGDQNEIIVFESYPAGMWYPEYFDTFKEHIERFIMEHTQDWFVAHTNANRIEGTNRAILKKRTE